jgi:hypothetical protein
MIVRATIRTPRAAPVTCVTKWGESQFLVAVVIFPHERGPASRQGAWA